MNRFVFALATLGWFGCSDSGDIPPFCEDFRSTVIVVNVSESEAENVDQVAASGDGCREADVNCDANWENGSCRTYVVEVSLAEDDSEGICQISVSYVDGRTPDTLDVPVSMSHCGPVAGVDGESEFQVPLGSGGAGAGGAGGEPAGVAGAGASGENSNGDAGASGADG